ncbi:MAG: hypothetical protein EPO08_16570 [Rhodospirillaceae bacterium]|nr:MAG: hypothetical protein EPO08_16570 [Rhodospirillaceae bacterium]
MNERRVNQPVRVQAQKWFDALRTHLAAADTQSDVAERLRHWATLDDLLGDCPRLLPPLLVMAWQLRHEPAFADLFQTASGKIAEETSVALSPCGKSFDNVVLSHLHGAVRVYCERQEEAFLATERARHRPTGLAKVGFLAPLIKMLKRQRDEDFLAHYPQHGLYLSVKPHLRHPNQFALIEALATLPTSTVSILGDTIRGLIHDSSIRNLAALETRKCKFVTGLARLFAETLIEEAAAAQAAGIELSMTPAPIRANLAEIAGTALSHLAVDGLHLAKNAIAAREVARDVVIKMSAPMGYELWRVFADKDAPLNIAYCPAVMARALGGNAAYVHRKTSEALNSLPDKRIVESVVAALHDAAGPEALSTWAASAACVTVWARLANEIKQVLTQRGEGAVTPDSVAAFCQSLVPTFAALSAEGQQPVAESAPV